MRTETIYYAFDDSEFDNEEECLAYEKEIKDRMNAAVFYDDEKAIVDVEKDGTGNVYYIRIVDAKRALFLFAWLCDYCGFDYPNDDDSQPPLVRWRGHGNLLYSNWLNYFVYQTTPYDIKTIGE